MCVLLFANYAHASETTFITLGPAMMFTTDSVSAPSPISYSLGIGRTVSVSGDFSLQAHAAFFTSYYLYDDERAKPAEVENRTALALSSLVSLNALWTFGKTENHWLQIGAGPAIFARYGLQANGVSGAADEVSNINRYFWSDLHFLYPDICFSYTRVISQFALGAECRIYLPAASFADGMGFEDGIIAFSISLGKHKP